MKRLIIVFVMCSMQSMFSMQYCISEQIKKEMKELSPSSTWSCDGEKPRIDPCMPTSRILIARINRYLMVYKYYRVETDQQIDELVNQIPSDSQKMVIGNIWIIDWFYYDPIQAEAPVLLVQSDYEDALSSTCSTHAIDEDDDNSDCYQDAHD